MLCCIAKISGQNERCYRVTSDFRKVEEDTVMEDEKRKHPKSPIRFSECGIPVGAQLVYIEDDSVVATVVGDREVKYNGEVTSLSGIVKKLKGLTVVRGTLFFTYNGRLLVDIARETQWKEE